MFDIGWSEMAVIALVALIVIGPKELPHAMRAAAKWMRKARGLAREFQSGIDDMIREAELDDARKALQATRDMDLSKAIEETVDPTGQVREEAQSLEQAAHGADTEGDAGGDTAPATAEAPANAESTSAESASAESTSAESTSAESTSAAPANVAPPHSLTPPAAAGEASEDMAGTGTSAADAAGRSA